MGKYFFKLHRYMKPYFILFWLGMLIYSAQSFLFPLLYGYVSSGAMDAILAGDISILWNALMWFGLGLLTFMLSTGLGIYTYIVQCLKAERNLKNDLFKSFVATGIETAHGHSGEGVAAINTEADTASNGLYGNTLSNFLRGVIVIIGGSITVFMVDWRIGLGAWAVGGIGFLVQNRFTKPIARIGKEQLEENATAVSRMSDKLQGALTIRAYNMQERSLISFDKTTGRLKFLDFKRATISALQAMFLTLQGWLSIAVVFGLGGILVTQNVLTLASLMFLWPLSNGITHAFGTIGQLYADLQPPLVAAKKVIDRIDNAKVCHPALVAGPPRTPSNYQINIQKLNFKYMEASENTLKDISLEIPENKMVAFVGASGSGKSTLLRTIIGMYERDSLPITIGDINFADVNIKNWRKNFAFVDQSCTLFDMSIAENIALGAAGNLDTQSIKSAAARAFAHDFITELEGGYLAPAGEKGGVLSGGQRQRIAIARALAKGSKTIVFDEATSALDKDSEAYVMETIHSLRGDHTILICTHNLENTVTADMIVVMDEGVVVETGTHNELIAKNGVYKELYDKNDAA